MCHIPCSNLCFGLIKTKNKSVLPNSSYGLRVTDILKLAKSELELPRRERLLCMGEYVFTPLEETLMNLKSGCVDRQLFFFFGHILRPYFTQNDVLCPTLQSEREIGMLQMATMPPPSFSQFSSRGIWYTVLLIM